MGVWYGISVYVYSVELSEQGNWQTNLLQHLSFLSIGIINSLFYELF